MEPNPKQSKILNVDDNATSEWNRVVFEISHSPLGVCGEGETLSMEKPLAPQTMEWERDDDDEAESFTCKFHHRHSILWA